MIEIRSATADDIPFITEVYNDAIINTTATFDTRSKSIEDRMLWFKNHDGNHPIIVAENDGVLNGWASLTAWTTVVLIMVRLRFLFMFINNIKAGNR